MKKKLKTFYPILASLLFILSFHQRSLAVQPGEVMEWLGVAGGVNWTKGIVIAEGVGGYQPNNTNMPATVAGSMACRAALVVAQRNLLSMVQGVRVVGETYIRQVMMHNDHVKSVVSGMLRGYTISGRKLWPDGACQVTL
ncbi:hypothetical protein ACQZV8_21475, partial [Magnetococcales bacterium HHB-1]